MPTIKPLKGGNLARQAGIFCLDDRFQNFLFSCHAEEWERAEKNDIDTGAIAAIVVRQFCGIQSRAELDHNKEASKKFAKLMKEYFEWGKHAPRET